MMLQPTKQTDFNGIRIIPGEVLFRNAYEGKVFKEKLMILNVSPKPVFVKTELPNSNSFKVDKQFHGDILSCGLNLVIWISYTYTYSSAIFAQMVIYINDQPTTVNFEVLPSKSEVYCSPRNLNFGKINVGYAVHVEKLHLFNKGNRQTKFEFDISANTLGLSMSPRKGFIAGGSSVEIEVYLIGFDEGVHTKEVWIKCEHPFRLSVFVEVIMPKLYICSPHDYTESFLPIMFPPVYGGCRTTQSFDVFNFNMLETTFIIVPEYNFEIMAAHKVEEIDPTYKNFQFLPIEGDLKPSDSRRLEISFDPPKVKLLCDKVNFVCFRLIRLECQTVDKMITEHIKKPHRRMTRMTNLDMETLAATSIQKIDTITDVIHLPSSAEIPPNLAKMSFGNYIRICVYAVVKALKVEVVPLNFILNELMINTRVTRFMNIRNKSRTLPIFYEYKPIGYIHVIPPNGYIGIGEKITVKVVFSPTVAGNMETPIQIDFFYFSQPAGQKKSILSNVGSVTIPVFIPVKLITTLPPPKFNMGITPQITNEVGLRTEDIRFNSKVKIPKMAVQRCEPSKNLKDALISFPNDRPQALQPWRNKDVKCVTLFAKLPRAIAPEDEYMLTQKELKAKTLNDEYYLKYIRFLERKRAEGSHEEVLEDYITNKKKLLQHIPELHCTAHWKTTFGSFYQEEFAPLKPIEIYFVKITPPKIFFPGVVVNTKVKYSIEIFNENTFSVHTMLTSFHRHKKILPNLPAEAIVKANEKIVIRKFFTPIMSGLFSTVLNVYLNSSHFIPILLQAEVVRPVVSVDCTDFVFDDKNPSYTRQIPLRNNLNVAIVFIWDVPDNSCYSVYPMTGSIPSGRFINCELVYTPNFERRNCVKLEVNCQNGTGVDIHVNACYSKSNVEVLESKIEMPHIPLNILTVRKNVLRNEGLETVLFQLKYPVPCYGVSIKPEKGEIHGRSDIELTITFLFEVFVKFDIKVEIEFEYGSISFIVIGRVDFPMIICRPKETIQFKRIPAESFEILPFTIENKGESNVNLTFPKNCYPELTISGSHRVNISLSSNVEVMLEKKETVHLYVHFHPLDVCMNDFYLPIILNNILGPAERNDERSLRSEPYLKDISFSTYDDSNIETIHYTKNKMSVITISTVSTKHILRFSKTLLNFKYIPILPCRSTTSLEIKVKNCIKETVEFCIDISGMQPHFDISCKSCDSVIHRDDEVMAFSVDEEVEITLIAFFIPNTPGEFDCSLPVYIKNVKNETVFNYLKLNAVYPPPTFKTPRWCFLEPVPLNTVEVFDLKLLLCNHYPNCSLNIISELEQLTVTLKGFIEDPDEPCRSEVSIQLRFFSKNPISMCSKLHISCSCGADTFLVIGVCAAEDIISAYTHYCPSVPFEKTMRSRGFPYFPQDSDDSEYANYMRKCVTITERWIFDQALHQTYYYSIPEDMSGYSRTISSKKKKIKPVKGNMLVLIHILTNIGFAADLTLTFPEVAKDELTRVNHVHCNFKHILIFLHQQGAYLPHIRSRYLLTYDEYILYITKIRPMKQKSAQNVKPEDLYYRRSKQCWLDLILCIFKTLVLSRISLKKYKASRRQSSVSKDSSSMLAINLNPEPSLLFWVDLIYHEEITNLIKLDGHLPKDFVPKPKTIMNYTSDLSDSLALLAITIHFCPYLTPNLQDIYVIVDAPEKAFHNAVVLIESWKLVKSSFKITPLEIVNPMALQMVFLITYIYDVFDSLNPKEVLNFSGSLSTKDKQEIILRNPNTCELNYEICFLNNQNGCFQSLTTNNFIRIPAGKAYSLKIEYTAKKIETQTVTLLLSGDTPGQLYGKSLAYTLIGESNFLGEHVQVVFEVDLYKSMTIDLEIQSPYKEAAIYDCLCARSTPKEVSLERLIYVQQYLASIRPRTIFTDEYSFVTDEKGIGSKKITICCLSTNDFDATIVFRSPNVGDFFISILVQPINFDLIERHTLVVDLPEDWDDRVCNCCGTNKLLNPKRCDRRITLSVPCKNDQFWNIIIEAIMQSISPSERGVWYKFLENEMGPHILHWLMSGTQEVTTVQHMLDSNITYIVNNRNSSVLLPDTVIIENVRSDNLIEMDMHVMGDIAKMKTTDFSLQSTDGTEFRWYAIEFRKSIKPESVGDSVFRDIVRRPMFHSIL